MTAPSRRCPECSAHLTVAAERCWLCGADLAAGAKTVSPPPSLAAEERNTATFTLSSLFLVMTLAAVAAASFSVAPGVGIAFVIIATPAFVRTIVITSRQKALGITTTPGQKVLTFCGSVGLVTLLLLSIPVALSMARDMFGKHASAASRGPSELTCLGALGWVMWMVWRRGKNK